MTRTSYKQTYTPEKKICKCGHTLSYGSYLAIYWCDYCDAEPINEIGGETKRKQYYKKKKKVKNLISET